MRVGVERVGAVFGRDDVLDISSNGCLEYVVLVSCNRRVECFDYCVLIGEDLLEGFDVVVVDLDF